MTILSLLFLDIGDVEGESEAHCESTAYAHICKWSKAPSLINCKYQLSPYPNDESQWLRRYTPGEFPLPTETQSAEFYRMASRTLSEAGVEHYEIGSYGKKRFKCKHSVTYWQNKFFYAFGLGSASYLDWVRFSRSKRMKEYVDHVQILESGVVEQLQDCQFDAKDIATDVVMLSLRTSKGLELKSFREAFGSSVVVDLCKAFIPHVKSWHVIAPDEESEVLDAHEFSSVLSDARNIEEVVEFIRLSDPDGFLLSNELISVAFAAISP